MSDMLADLVGEGGVAKWPQSNHPTSKYGEDIRALFKRCLPVGERDKRGVYTKIEQIMSFGSSQALQSAIKRRRFSYHQLKALITYGREHSSDVPEWSEFEPLCM